MNLAFELHDIAIDLGIALEGFFDALLDIDNVHPRAQGDLVVHTQHTGQLAHGPFSGFFLILPVHFAFQGDPAFLHNDLDGVFGNIGAPGDDIQGAVGDGVVVHAGTFCQPDLYFFRHRANAPDAFDRLFGADFLSVAFDMTGERDNTVIHRHANVGGVDFGVELKLFHYGIAQTQIAHEGVLWLMHGGGSREPVNLFYA